MTRRYIRPLILALTIGAAAIGSACGAGDAKAKERPATPTTVDAAPVAAVEQPVARFIRATGTLMAEEQAEVAAETTGRVVGAPVERGTPVAQGDAAGCLGGDLGLLDR